MEDIEKDETEDGGDGAMQRMEEMVEYWGRRIWRRAWTWRKSSMEEDMEENMKVKNLEEGMEEEDLEKRDWRRACVPEMFH